MISLLFPLYLPSPSLVVKFQVLQIFYGSFCYQWSSLRWNYKKKYCTLLCLLMSIKVLPFDEFFPTKQLCTIRFINLSIVCYFFELTDQKMIPLPLVTLTLAQWWVNICIIIATFWWTFVWPWGEGRTTRVKSFADRSLLTSCQDHSHCHSRWEIIPSLLFVFISIVTTIIFFIRYLLILVIIDSNSSRIMFILHTL